MAQPHEPKFKARSKVQNSLKMEVPFIAYYEST
jgi:hypothetical protein